MANRFSLAPHHIILLIQHKFMSLFCFGDWACSGSAGNCKNEKLQVLFEEWCSSGEDWKRSEMIVQMRTKRTHRVKGCRKWLTEAEIAAKYQSAEVARDIVLVKLENPALAQTQVRFHPDLPGRMEHRQFLVYDYAEEVDQNDEVLESLFLVEDGDSDGETKPKSKDSKGKDKRGRSRIKSKKYPLVI